LKRSGFSSPGKGFKPRAKPMNRGTSTLTTKKPLQHGASQLARASTAKAQAMPADEPKAPVKRMASRGMKGRAPTAEEQRFMDKAGQFPCMACTVDGIHNTEISLHHTDGRTKPGAHFKVLPLCAPHHQQDDTDPLRRPSVHGRKATFTARYGTEAELVDQLHMMIEAEVAAIELVQELCVTVGNI
jgi:hypothetical protein